MAEITEEDIEFKVNGYIKLIPPENKKMLDSTVDKDKDIYCIAKKILKSWENKYFYLELGRQEKEDIKEKYSNNQELQRIEALMTWKNKTSPNNTYRNLLEICVQAEWSDAAKAIVKIITDQDKNVRLKARRCSIPETSTGIGPLAKKPRLDTFSSGATSSIEETNISTATHSGRNSANGNVLPSLQRHRIMSSYSGNSSDTERDFPKGRSESFTTETHSQLLQRKVSTESRVCNLTSEMVGSNSVELPAEYAERKIELKAALDIISNVTKYLNLGVQLFIPSEKLNEINHYQPEEQKTKIIQAWFEHDSNPTYGTLHRALLQSSVNDVRAAMRLSRLSRTDSMDSSVSIDGIHHESSSVTEAVTEEEHLNQATVLNAITQVSNDFELGIRLGLEPSTMNEIKQYHVDEQKQKLVDRLFTIRPENCTWAKINGAINYVKVMEWNDRKSSTSVTSSDTSFRKSFISVTSSDTSLTNITTTTSSSVNFDMNRNEELVKWNDNNIKSKYSSLKMKIAKKLNGISPEDICSFIQSLTNCEDSETILKDSKNAGDIFNRLYRHKYWCFYDISQLYSIVKEFIEDNDDLIEEIDAYEERLTGFKAVTKIREKINWDRLRINDDDHNTERTPANCYPCNRKELVITLMDDGDLNVTDYTIKHLEEVFERFQKRFKHSLDAVLYKVTEGSVTVTWYISSLSAQNTLTYLHESVDFIKSLHVSTIFLENCLIYSDSIGAVNTKELDEVKLLIAVQDGSTDRVNSLINGVTSDIDQITPVKHPTLLMRAANGGNVDIISTLINHGAKVNEQDEFGWSALSYAGLAGHTEAVECLLKHRADITLPSKSTKYPNILDLIKFDKKEICDLLKDGLNQNLIKDAKDGNADSVKAALKMGADVEALDKEKEGWVALAWASHHGHFDAVDHLLDSKANPNVQCGEYKWSPLILASRNGHVEIVKQLLHSGADLEQSTVIGWSPLRFAAAFERVEVGKILIDSKADVNSIDDEHGYNPLSQAAQDGKADFISMLIEKVPNLDLNVSTEKGGGWTPLMLACKNGHTDAVRLLLLNGASANHQKKDNVAAIHVASFAGNDKVVKSLVRFGADVNVADEWGVTSLMFAAKEGHVGVVKALNINKNLDFNLQEGEAKFSAPFFAIQCKHFDVLKELMRSEKVDCNKTDLHGKTLWKLIEKTKFEDAKTLFKETYPEEMHVMMSMTAKPSPPQAAAMEGPLPTVKSMLDSHSPDLYIQNMLNRIDNRMKKRAAGAA